MAKWLRRLTRNAKVRMAVGSNPTLGSLVTVRNSSPGQPEPCEGNLVAAVGSCGGLMAKHLWPQLEISLSDFRRLAMLNINTYLRRLLSLACSHACCAQIVARKTEDTATEMTSRCILPTCSNNPDKEHCIALHKIPFFNDDRPEAKRRRKRWVDFINSERADPLHKRYSSLLETFHAGEFCAKSISARYYPWTYL